MMKRSIFFSIFIGYVLLVMVLSSLILVFSLRTIRRHHLETLTCSLVAMAGSLEPAFARALKGGAPEELDSLAKDLGTRTDTRITFINPEGVVMADSWEDPRLMENHRTQPEVMQALRGVSGTSLRPSPTIQQDFLYAARPLIMDGAVAGVLRVSLPLKDIDESLAGLRNNIMIITGVVIALSLAGALILSRSLSRPIRELQAASKRLASGDFDTKVFLRGRDEIKDLADSFNYMADRIHCLFTELSQKEQELTSLVTSMQDGLVLLDGSGRIILSNASFRRIAGSTEVEGKFYWEVIRVPQLDELVRGVIREKINKTREVSVNDRVYVCSGDALASHGGVVVLMHDITDIRALEKVKKDFVVSLSHELRTPLTAIAGFLETLEEEVTEPGRGYLAIVRRHTERLACIVDDLLLLSELEDSSTRLDLENVHLQSLIEDVLHIFQPRAREKGIALGLARADGVPAVQADRFKLEQVFINLIANAVKYTEEGSIAVRLRREGEDLVTEIEDTGIGISEEHLPRIFERFYVVDKSRSKRVGGTGLGLSIVKHIVLLHHGSVGVESKPGEGTKVTIRLPVKQSPAQQA